MSLHRLIFVFLCLTASVQGHTINERKEPAPDTPPILVVDGVTIQELVVGHGALAEKGSSLEVHYTGWLDNGKKFDSSLDRKQPFVFRLGKGSVIKGWETGLAGMRVGGRRKITIPPDMGYGKQGAGGLIPPNSTLVFEVELLSVK